MSGKANIIKKKVSEASRSEQQQAKNPVQACPNKNWIELVYQYNSTRAVSGASYEVFDAATNQSLACGKLDNMGFARVEGLPDSARRVKFTFFSDPKPFELYPGYKPKPHNLTPETKEIKEEDGTVMSVAKWIGTALAGDFIEEQSYGQIAFGTVVTMIPVVDQVGDVRDIIANLYKLTWQKRYNEFDPWFSLVVTIIGCVPAAGSAVKGVCKIIRKFIKEGVKKLPLTKLIRMLNSIGEGNVIRYLRKIADNLKSWGEEAAAQIRLLLDALNIKLLEARRWAFSKAEELLDTILANFEEVRRLAPEMARKVVEEVADYLKKSLEDVSQFVMKGATRARNGARQLKEKFIVLTNKELRALALRAGMKPEHLHNLSKHCKDKGRMVVVRFTNPDSLQHQGKKIWWNGVEKQMFPKPLPVKLKTAKDGKLAGIVVEPRKPKDWDAKNPGKEWQMEDWEAENIKDLKKDGYFFDNDGILRDKDGNAFYGDYDVQSVHRRVDEIGDDGVAREGYLNELSNPDDKVSVIDEMNKDVVGDIPQSQHPFQHGAEGDFRVRTDENGKVMMVDKDGRRVEKGGKPVPVSSDEMNSGARGGGQMQADKDYKLGRQHGDDEQYVIVDADGNISVAKNPQELKELYDNLGLPWEYDSRFPTAPASAAAAGGR